ncbi:MAG TPA: hypothetical protein EYP49_18855 [Anaerolineae bacterium]|nr:hypothetical protein [Anaerolineae bacterium]
MRQVEHDDEIVIFEYEPGIFWLGGLVRAMAWLRFRRRKRVLLSVHEIAPEKYPEFRQIQWHLARPVSRRRVLEVMRLLLSTVDVALRFLMLRIGLLLMGWLPHLVLVHSPKTAENICLSLPNNSKVRYVPHVVKRLEGNRDVLRRQLGLPSDRFAFIIPGFLFRRKRIIEVIEQLPPNAELWVVGTESEYDPGYLAEIQAHLLQSENRERVRLIQDYDRMEQYLLAADAAVFYYADGYQSGVASLAVGAGKPCIFSALPAFSDLREAGLVVRTPGELRQAMEGIQQRETYAALQAGATQVRKHLNPSRIAACYV